MPSGLFAALAANVIVILIVVANVKARRKRTPKPFILSDPRKAAGESFLIYCGLSFAFMILFGVLRFF